VERFGHLGTSRGRRRCRPRALRLGVCPRRTLDGRRMALRRRHGDPAPRHPDVSRSPGPGWSAPLRRPGRARGGPRARPRTHPVDLAVPCHDPRPDRPTQLPGRRSRHSLDSIGTRARREGPHSGRRRRPGAHRRLGPGLRFGLVGPALAREARSDPLGSGIRPRSALFHRVGHGRVLHLARAGDRARGGSPRRATSSRPSGRNGHRNHHRRPVASRRISLVGDCDRRPGDRPCCRASRGTHADGASRW
jgi:hypothetical protein